MLSAMLQPSRWFSADFLNLQEIGFSRGVKRSSSSDDDKISGFDVPRVSRRDYGIANQFINGRARRNEQRYNTPGERQKIQRRFIWRCRKDRLLRTKPCHEVRSRTGPCGCDNCANANLLRDVVGRASNGVSGV